MMSGERQSGFLPTFGFTDQRLKQRQAQWPRPETRFQIDVPKVVKADKFAAPGPGISASQTHRAIRVIAAGHNDAVIWQAPIGNRGKVDQRAATLRVIRCQTKIVLKQVR